VQLPVKEKELIFEMVFDSIDLMDLFHYVLVLAAISFYWLPAMQFFGGNVWLTLGGALIVFIAADKVAHQALGVD
jgi:hypothetical protein